MDDLLHIGTRKWIEETWPDTYSDAILLSSAERALVGKVVQCVLAAMIDSYDRRVSWVPEDCEPPEAYTRYGKPITHDHTSAHEHAVDTLLLIGIIKEFKGTIFQVVTDHLCVEETLTQRINMTRRMLSYAIEALFNVDRQYALSNAASDMKEAFLNAGLLETKESGLQWTDRMDPYFWCTWAGNRDAQAFFEQLYIPGDLRPRASVARRKFKKMCRAEEGRLRPGAKPRNETPD